MPSALGFLIRLKDFLIMYSFPENQPKIVIAGGNGFLGQHLVAHFQELGYRVVVMGRSVTGQRNQVQWDAHSMGPWAAELEGAAALINMAGRSVDCRYTKANRQEILASRVDSTRVLGEAVATCTNPPRVWLNASTATIYAHSDGWQRANTETNGKIGTGFSVDVAKAWEAAFWARETPNTRRVALRTSIVLAPGGGAFPVVTKLAKRGLCTPQGNGYQWISWLHIKDFCRAVEFLINETEQVGTFNICAPTPLTNRDFNALLTRELRPLLRIPQPVWLLELGAFVLRTETELILKSRKVVPQRLLDLGFRFRYPTCERAVADLLH
ncbi:TIGR01777 family oxidoreductase [Hymenobacter sp. YC55]|uniref:TIGR01777 family oxidoreductase n=1 Tax=Hymenobacter sp. YC55 TaxID=3034019 RepID=UPI0023F72B06|nr:TIGR01777 family oxidoreductase [Hymenobacter sp. YC55]MDF7813358.1 TIGR01777 family oxidoreductase [Hymenobacter sp. YC55]